MKHRLAIERLFNLGQYSNIKVIVEVSDIDDHTWEDVDLFEKLKSDVIEDIIEVYTDYKKEESAAAEKLANK